MFLHHFLEEIAKLNAPKFTEVNVSEVNYNFGEISFGNPDLEYEMDLLKEDFKTEQDLTKRLSEEKDILEKSNEELEEKLTVTQDLMRSYEISPTDTIGDLVSRNEWQEEQLKTYKQSVANFSKTNLDLERQLKEIRARTNKATIKRDINTGELIATYKETEYKLIKK